MKSKSDILNKHVRERLKDFEQSVPDNLWEIIEEDLVHSENIFRKRILWQRLSIAASFLLVLTLGTLFFLDHEERNPMLTEKKIELSEMKSDPVLLAEKNDPVVSNPETDNKLKQPVVYSSKKYSCHIEKGETEEATDVTEPVTGIESQHPFESEKKKPEEEKSEPTRPVRNSSAFYEDVKTADNCLWRDASGKKKKNKGISYALAFGNSGNFKNEIQQSNKGYYNEFQNYTSPSLSHPSIFADLTKQELTNNKTNNYTSSQTDYNHDFPISVGLTVRKQFSDAFAMETGLVYTHLSSKGTIRSTTPVITNNTSLNYLGIPVKAVYSLFENNRFSVYASAGGMVEKSIAGKFKTNTNNKIITEDLNVKELQWSVSGAVGINYQLVGRLGLFVEPGASYYFDDGTDVMTIRKDQPLSFTLQGGLRLTY